MELCTYSEDNAFIMPMIYIEKNQLDIEDTLRDRFCIILIEDGTGIVKLNNKNVAFIAPTIFAINESESIIIEKGLNVKIKIIYFHPNIINSILNFNNIRNMPEEFSPSTIQDCYWLKCFTNHSDVFNGKINIGPLTAKRLAYLFETFRNESTLQNRDNWPCRSRSYIMEILFLIENVYSAFSDQKDTLLPTIDEEIRSIVLYLIQNYDKKITIDELTKRFNINRTTLSQKFNSSLGESIVSYLNRTRISMASIILRDTRLPISEVMIRVGFNESSYFLRSFKKFTGMSPKSYRDAYCWMQ